MAFDAYLGERIGILLTQKNVIFLTKKMIGGLVFMVNDKMCCGTHLNKKYGDHLLMCRIGIEAHAKQINKKVCLPMDFTGRPMKGYVFITPDGYDLDTDLDYWIQLALDFNEEIK